MHEQTRQAYKERILQVLVHIQTHLDHPLPLDELAGLAHFSPYHFHRVFRGMVGEPVKEHVRRLRLERAAHRLRFSDQPIIYRNSPHNTAPENLITDIHMPLMV